MSYLVPAVEHGRVRLTVNASPGLQASVIRVHPSGKQVPVRNFTLVSLSDGIAVGWDYEMPIGRLIYYIANIYDPSDLDNPLAVLTSNTITWDTLYDWFKDPYEPARNVTVDVSSMPSYQYSTPVSVHPVLNRPDPIAIGQTRQASTGSLAINTYTSAEREAMQLILSSGNPLLLQTTVESGVNNFYIMVTDTTEDRVSPIRDAPERVWTLTFQEIGAPAGDGGAFVTYDDLLASNPDYQGVIDTWDSYVQMFTQLDHSGQGETLNWRGA